MEWLRLVLDKLFSWPVVALVAIAVFRDPLRRLLRRLRKLGVGKEGVTLEAGKASVLQDSQALRRESPEREFLRGLDDAPVSPVVTQVEQSIHSSLYASTPNEDDTARVRRLIRALATTHLYWQAEVTYRNIFGSQIALLRRLSAGDCLPDQLKAFYESARAANPGEYRSYSFEQYLGFLLSTQFIETRPGTDLYAITEAGKAFLTWLTASRLPENKPF